MHLSKDVLEGFARTIGYIFVFVVFSQPHAASCKSHECKASDQCDSLTWQSHNEVPSNLVRLGCLQICGLCSPPGDNCATLPSLDSATSASRNFFSSRTQSSDSRGQSVTSKSDVSGGAEIEWKASIQMWSSFFFLGIKMNPQCSTKRRPCHNRSKQI